MLEQNDMSQADLARSLVSMNQPCIPGSPPRSRREWGEWTRCVSFLVHPLTAHKRSLNNGQSNHYINVETQKIAQEIYEDEDLRALFSAARDASAEDLKTAHDILKALKAKERGEHD